ncbi:MAG: outer membrane lipid asymmetry maintenance protein MlaD [Deltaproteobacteria bacterium]
MKKHTMETTVGVFVFIGILCVGYLTLKLGKLNPFDNGYYEITARFSSVEGLKPGASVDMAGVEIGTVSRINIDKEEQVAVVSLLIRRGIELTDDTIASIKTNGLIGDKFIRISSGGADQLLKAGGRITQTEPSVSLEDLISKYIFGKV